MKIYRQVFSPIQVNTYILADADNKCIIIDAGCYDTAEEQKLEKFVDKNALTPAMLLNTHCHLDHVFGNGFMLRKYGLSTRCHRDDYYNLKETPSHAAFFGLTMEAPPEPGEFLNEGDKCIFQGLEFEILAVPGHTPGSLAFYFPSEEVVFTGDALFAGSIGRTDFAHGDYNALIESITSKLFTLPDDTVVYPGHGRETTIGHEKKTNPFFR